MLFSVAIAVTVLVYGVVALIVKAGEVGLAMARSEVALSRAIGRGIVRTMPLVMRALSTIGVAAMLWVGGEIVAHGIAVMGAPAPENAIKDLARSVGDSSPILGGALEWTVKVVVLALIGVVLGGLVAATLKLALAPLWSRIRPRASRAA